MNGGPQPRESSPVSRASTLTTSAPMSPSICVQKGPARARLKSTTRRPLSADSVIVAGDALLAGRGRREDAAQSTHAVLHVLLQLGHLTRGRRVEMAVVLAHSAELLITGVHGLTGRDLQQLGQRMRDRQLEEMRGMHRIAVRATFRLGDDLVHDAQLLEVVRGEPQ